MARPNILFILIDDMGWRDIGCYGSSFYETPHLDLLAQQGMRFTDAYAACPVCSPTRASILTGKYPATLGVTDWIDWGGQIHPCKGRVIDVPYLKELPHSETTLARALHAGGYHTYHVGKWHLGGPEHFPEEHGFAVNVGGCEWGMPIHGYFSPYGNPRLADGPVGEYLTDRLTDEAITLIEQTSDDEPFFMYLSHYAVHTPIQAPAELIAKYEAKQRMLGLDKVPTFTEGDFFPSEWKQGERIQRRLVQSDPAYAAMVQNLDWNIGRVLDALARSGKADNTIVIFTSDNGGLATAEGSPTCNAPLAEGKGWMHEGGTREPLIVRWPGVTTPDSTCEVPVSSPDFYPTLLAAAGLDPLPAQHVDGVDITPLLHGEACERGPLFWHYPHYGNQGGTPGSSVRDGEYKLIEFFEDGRLELYNLRGDVGETCNLAEVLPAVTARLHAQLVAWRARIEAKIPQPNPDFVPWQEGDRR